MIPIMSLTIGEANAPKKTFSVTMDLNSFISNVLEMRWICKDMVVC